MAEGYPLRWLTAVQGIPEIAKGALLRDSVQWALGCTSLLYLVWAHFSAVTPADPD